MDFAKKHLQQKLGKSESSDLVGMKTLEQKALDEFNFMNQITERFKDDDDGIESTVLRRPERLDSMLLDGFDGFEASGMNELGGLGGFERAALPKDYQEEQEQETATLSMKR